MHRSADIVDCVFLNNKSSSKKAADPADLAAGSVRIKSILK